MSTIDFKKIDYYESLLDFISKKYPYIILEAVNEYKKKKEGIKNEIRKRT